MTAMLSIDTNLLFHAFNVGSPSHKTAYAWLTTIPQEEAVAISEFILAELYGLLRNPAAQSGTMTSSFSLMPVFGAISKPTVDSQAGDVSLRK